MIKENKKRSIASSFKNSAWVFFTLLGIQSLAFKEPYAIVLGFFLISTGFIFFPWLDNLTNLFRVKLTTKNKWFIFIVSLFLSAYLINPEEVSYLKCILPICLIVILWILVIVYRKIKESSKK